MHDHSPASFRNRNTAVILLLAAALLVVVSGLIYKQASEPQVQPIGRINALAATGTNEIGEAFPKLDVANNSTAKAPSQAEAIYGQLPLSFERNEGQTDGKVKFLARGHGYSLFLTDAGPVLSLRKPGSRTNEQDSIRTSQVDNRADVVTLTLAGARQDAPVAGLDQQPGNVNYFVGNDRSKWRTGVSTYSKIRYDDVYPGIDVIYYGNQGQLEYDFVVEPGVDPAHIKLDFDGVRKIRINNEKELVLETNAGEVVQRKPVAYQEIKGQRTEVAANYRIEGTQVRFELGEYERKLPLIIDPVLVYSSYLGGGNGFEQGLGIAVDDAGSAYLTGFTDSTDFPLANAMQPTIDLGDVFVLKLNPAGSALVYSTYIGGNADDLGNAIAVDSAGNAYVVGVSGSTNFPVTPGAWQTSRQPLFDSFVLKLNPTGSALVYSSYFGGDNFDSAVGVAVDAAGRAHVVGRTDSTRLQFIPVQRNGSPVSRSTDRAATWSDFSQFLTASTVNGLTIQPSNPSVIYAATNYGVFKTNGGIWELTGTTRPSTAPMFSTVVAIDPTNSSVVYAGASSGLYKSTNGGSLYDHKAGGFEFSPSAFVQALAIDPSNTTTVYAGTQGGIFKSTNGGDSWVSIRNNMTGSNVNEIVMDPTNTATIYAGTTLGIFKSTNGGAQWSQIHTGALISANVTALAMDPTNPSTLYLGSATGPTRLYKTTNGGGSWSASDTGLNFGFGGPINALAVDPAIPSTLYAATSPNGVFKSVDGGANWAQSNSGLTNTNILSIAINPVDTTNVYEGLAIGNDTFAIRMNSSGTDLEYLMTFGGTDTEDPRGIALDTDGTAHIIGSTNSRNFPVQNAYQAASGGVSDAFLTKLNSTGTGFVYSTYFGGSAFDFGRAVAVRNGAVFIAGTTNSANFPLANAFKSSLIEFDTDAFVSKFDSGSSLVFSTYLGGTTNDQAFGIAVDASNNVYVTGQTSGFGFPEVDAAQQNSGGGTDAFITKFESSGASLVYSTYLGGSASERGNAIAVDSAGAAYVTGTTTSSNFPLVSAFQPTTDLLDAFVAKVAGAPPAAQVRLSVDEREIVEGSSNRILIDVTRTGNLATEVTVKYATGDGAGLANCSISNGAASERCDYQTTVGTLRFTAGEATKSIIIPIINDVLDENDETFFVQISHATGAVLGAPNVTAVKIVDNDTGTATTNPIDDPEFFITQQYIDFLGRLPDPDGLAAWMATLTNCPNGGYGEFDNPHCDRVHISSGFFLSDEFRGRGYWAYRFYEVAFNRRPTYSEFVPDMAKVGGPQSPESEELSKGAYKDEFVQRGEFTSLYGTMSNALFVNELEFNAEIPLNNAELTAQLDGGKSRAQLLREIVELKAVEDQFFIRAFVAMQYFGYLRRNPDTNGYNDWVTALTANPSDYRHMIFGFIYSQEYRGRFGTP